MTKFFRWCTLLAGLCCVVLIPWSFFRAPHPLDFSNGENVVRVVGALFVCAALCKIGVGALRDRQAIRSIPQAGSVTLRMGPMGQFRNPEINLLNSRVAKKFGFGESRQLRVVLDVFNIMNSNAATSISYLTGSTYDHVQGFVSPRVARIGADFSF